MNTNIISNTQRFAKPNIVKALDHSVIDDLDEKVIYVPKPENVCNRDWNCVLVDGATQSAKTWKAFDVIANRTTPGLETLALFITQSNSKMAVNQIISRARKDSQISQLYKTITNSSIIFEPTSTTLIAGFWHSRNMDAMFEYVDNYSWDQVFIVLDEIDEGGKVGLKTRLDFVRRVEKAANCPVRLVFITATVANLSKSIVEIAKSQPAKFSKGVVDKIIHDVCVEHHYVVPRDEYIGPSYFTTNNLWRKLVIPRKVATQSRDDFITAKNNAVNVELEKLTDEQKELCLIVTSTQREEHRAMAKKMFLLGFNVVVEMNGENIKNYNVYYRGNGATVTLWQIPYSDIETLAERGMLDTYLDPNGNTFDTGIESKQDLTMPYIIQSALFMNTNAQNRILKNVEDEEMVKLRVLGNAICTSLDKTKRRPLDFPKTPRVALITGHLANRGNSIQSPIIDLACTAFCFVGKTDTAQRGATNAQRFGRACGMLSDIFVNQKRQPILIATQNIVQDALANEAAVKEKGEELKEGELVSLKSLLTKADWDRVIRNTKQSMICSLKDNIITRRDAMRRLLAILASNKATCLTYAQMQARDVDLYKFMKKYHNELLNWLAINGHVVSVKKSYWKITHSGKELLSTLS